MKQLHMVSFLLLVVGGLNWLLVGLFQFDLVMTLFGGLSPMLVKLVYILVGLAAIAEIVMHKANCRTCSVGDSQPAM